MIDREVIDYLKSVVLEVNDDISPQDIQEDRSLVGDLGLDSLRLAEFVSRVKGKYGDIDLTDWFVAAAREGSDTIRDLALFLQNASGSNP